MTQPHPALRYDTWIAFVFVFVFGVAYLYVALDPLGPAARGIALLGVAAKIASVTPQLFYQVSRAQETPMLLALPMASDYVFGGLFAWFVRSSRAGSRLT